MDKEESSNSGTKKSIGRAREISALLASNSLIEAAKRAGVSESTMKRRLKDDGFLHTLHEAESRYLEATIARLSKIQNLALDKLEGLLLDPNTPPTVLLGAIRATFDINLKLRELRNFEKRIENLEKVVKEISE